MKFVSATVEAAIALVLFLALFNWATGMVSQASDSANIVGLVGGLGGVALLLFVVQKRLRFYLNV